MLVFLSFDFTKRPFKYYFHHFFRQNIYLHALYTHIYIYIYILTHTSLFINNCCYTTKNNSRQNNHSQSPTSGESFPPFSSSVIGCCVSALSSGWLEFSEVLKWKLKHASMQVKSMQKKLHTLAFVWTFIFFTPKLQVGV